ncbi:xylulose kinase [Arthrobacter livingstonensis]|uniref:Xylulose kinase n=1 Tax=Arthrobacter livingstonensis TaxID=670078 RepID=A0A2V5L9N9_9MICC|nr:FGGY family carbohydrate kinase [Arthrobacter livingstonensis]PYI68199.1 xylulose kinase [Arthrobacter livingstonensis]
MNIVVGVDSSTQSCKVLAVNVETGEQVATGSATHPDGTAVDPGIWTSALSLAWDAAGIAGLGGQVIGAAVAAQQHGMVAVDAGSVPVHDALLWNDVRSAAQAAGMVAELGVEAWADAVNLVPVASFTLTKLAWLAHKRPDDAARVATVGLPHDWLNLQLTGRWSTDRSDASGTAYFDPRTDRYRTELLERFFGSVPALPPVLAPEASAGRLLPRWGASAAVVGAGMGDNAGAALGLELAPGEIVVSVGTSGTVFGVSATPIRDASGEVAGFADATGGHLPLLAMINSARVLAAGAAMLKVDLAEFDRLALAAAPDAGGLTLLPYLDGERTPNLPDATGTLVGMTRANMVPENLARACVLAVLNPLADALAKLAGLGVPVERVLLIGGGSKSRALREAAAAVFGVPVEVPQAREYVALGAARQAAWAATGKLPVWGRRIEESFEPAGDWGAVVRERYIAARRAVYAL